MAGRFPQQWLDELRERADIVSVVSRYVQLNQKGGRYWGLCPFHGEKTASFSVNPQMQMYYCFGCHAAGSSINFVMKIERLEFHEAVEQLAEQFNMEIPAMVQERADGPSRSEKERLYEANRQCARFFHRQLWQPENRAVLDYLYRRGLDDAIIRMFGLGSTPPRGDGATKALTEAGFTEDELVRAGISVRRDGRVYDMFRRRAIFPIIDAHGHVLGFGGRALGDEKPKYLNTGDTPIFNKRLGVFAANLLRKERGMKRVILTEGYMDVVALTQAGLRGVCATLGTALTLEQARLLKRYAPEIWVSYDGDAAGQHAILRALDIFEEEGVSARVLDFPDGMDPDEYVRAYGAQAVEQMKPVDPTTYRIRQEAGNFDLSTQEGRTNYAIACAKHLRKVSDPVRLENHIQQLMITTGFPRDVLLAQVGRAEMIPKPKQNLYHRTIKPLDEAALGADRDAGAPEKQLLRLLAEGKIESGMVSEADFITPLYARIAKMLCAGMKPGAILEEIADEQERQLAGSVLLEESGATEETALRMADECLRKLRERRINTEIDEIREQMNQLTGQDKRQAYERLSKLTAMRLSGRKE